MTDAEILNKVIQMAEEKGFLGRTDTLHYNKPNKTDLAYGRNIELCEVAIYLNTYQGIIMSHEFAKAFWSEDKTTWTTPDGKEILIHQGSLKVWEFHLQQMVIKAEPIKYLSQFVI